MNTKTIKTLTLFALILAIMAISLADSITVPTVGNTDLVNESLNLKVNISGDNMTGSLNVSTGNFTLNGGNFYSNKVNGFYYPNWTINTVVDNQNQFDTIFSNNYLSGSNDINFALFQVVGNNTGHYNSFQARRARGSLFNNGSALVYPLVDNDLIFRIMGTGYDGINWGGSRVYIDLRASGNWNSTSHGTKLEFYSTPSTAGANTQKVMVITEEGKIQLPLLSGVGNRPICASPTGDLVIC